MKSSNSKSLLGIAIAIFLLSLVSISVLFVQSFDVCTNGSDLAWREDLFQMQMIIFTGKLFFKTAFYILLFFFLIKQHKAIKNGVLFPRANVLIMYFMAAFYFLGNFCQENIKTFISAETPHIVLNFDTTIYTLLLIIFALMYKVAAKVSEENNLTI